MYNPREDSYLLAQYASTRSGSLAIDMCTGSGIIANALSDSFETVVGIDIDSKSLEHAKENVDARFIQSDGFSEVEDFSADLITCNPPYLPDSGIDDHETESGKEGIQFSKQFLHDARNYLNPEGTILLIVSTVANHQELLDYAGSLGYSYDLLDSVSAFFEKICLYEFKMR